MRPGDCRRGGWSPWWWSKVPKRLILGGLLLAAPLLAPSAATAAQDVICGHPDKPGFQCRYERTQEPGLRIVNVWLSFNTTYRGFVTARMNTETGEYFVQACDRGPDDGHFGPGFRVDHSGHVHPSPPAPEFGCWVERFFTIVKFRATWEGHSTQWFSRP